MQRVLVANGKALRFEGSTYDLDVVADLYMIQPYRQVAELCHEGDVVVDIGAHQGGFSLMCAAYGAKVFAIDPRPANIQLLIANAERNRLGENVVALQEAISSTSGLVDLAQGSDCAHACVVYDVSRDRITGNTVKVRGQTLANLFEEQCIERCKIIKSDCEGGEWGIFTEDAIYPLMRTEIAIIEWHSGNPRSLIELLHTCAFDAIWTARPDGDPTLGGVVGFRNPVSIPMKDPWSLVQ